MYCPNCKQTRDGKFCPECGSKLIEEPRPDQDGISMNLGDANAISGGIHLNDSHNTQNIDNSVQNISSVSNVTHNITQVAAQKTQMEILQESKMLYLNACKRAYEDNVLEQAEADELERYRQTLPLLDMSTANEILDSVRRMTLRASAKTELPAPAKIRLKQLTEALKKNEIAALMRQIDSIEALVGKFSNDELQYKYYLVLAALRHERCIERIESSRIDKYWESFWSYLAYIKANNQRKAAEILYSLDDKFPSYPSDNINLLGVAGALMMGDKETAHDMLSTVAGDYSPSLQRFAETLYLLLEPEIASEMGATEQSCAFYFVNFFNIKHEEEPKQEAKPVAKTEPESKATTTSKQKLVVDDLKTKWRKMAFDGMKAAQEAEDFEDFCSVVDILYPAALAGESLAMLGVAVALAPSETQTDYAKQWIDKLLQLPDDKDTLLVKGMLYDDGGGIVEPDGEKAFELFKQAATQGSYDAQGSIAEMYYEGEHMLKDYKMALGWAKLAYEARHPAGLYIYGKAYYEGNGVPKDKLTGKRLLQAAAADQGSLSLFIMSAQDYINKHFN